MKVTSDKIKTIHRHYRTIEIEDGPTIDAGGDGPHESYYPGTLFTVDKLKLEWIGDDEPVSIEASGPYVGVERSAKGRYSRRYRMDSLPDWLKEVL